MLACEDGDGNKVFEKALELTDFSLPEIALWFTDNTILLPSESGAPAIIAPKFVDMTANVISGATS